MKYSLWDKIIFRSAHKNTPCAYFRSASRLSQKRLVLISEAPRAYFGSAPCLFRKRPVLISEAPRASWRVNGPFMAKLLVAKEKASASGKQTFLHFFIKKNVFRLLYNK